MAFLSKDEVTIGDCINHIVANNKEEFDRAREKGEMTVLSFDTNNPQKLIREDDFINDNILEERVKDQNQEILKWKHLQTWMMYKILKVVVVDGKFRKSKILTLILTLKNGEGEETKLWACSGINKERDPLEEKKVRFH